MNNMLENGMIGCIAGVIMGALVSQHNSDGAVPETGADDSQLGAVYRVYLAASEEFNKDKTASDERTHRLEQFHKIWRTRLTKALASAGANELGRFEVLSEIAAIEYALGNARNAILLSRESLASAPSAEHRARAAISALNYLFASTRQGETPVSDEVVRFITRDAEGVVRGKVADLGDVQSIDAINVLGDVYAVTGKPAMAIDRYVEASDLIEAKGSSGRLGLLMSDVILLKTAALMTEASEDRIDAVLSRLTEIEGGAYERGFRLLEFARSIDPREGPIFARIIERWIDKIPEDSWTPLLHKCIGESMIGRKDYAKAIEFLSNFLSVAAVRFEPRRPAIGDPDAVIRQTVESFGICLKMLGDEVSHGDLDGVLKNIRIRGAGDDAFVEQGGVR